MENEMVIMINLILFGVVIFDLFDKIIEIFVCLWFFEGCFFVLVIIVLYFSWFFFFLGMLLKN